VLLESISNKRKKVIIETTEVKGKEDRNAYRLQTGKRN
jgi:hypothetical protein